MNFSSSVQPVSLTCHRNVGRADNVVGTLGSSARTGIEGNCCQCYCHWCIAGCWRKHTVPCPPSLGSAGHTAVATVHLLPVDSRSVAVEVRPSREEVPEEFSCCHTPECFGRVAREVRALRTGVVVRPRLCEPVLLPSSWLSILFEFL